MGLCCASEELEAPESQENQPGEFNAGNMSLVKKRNYKNNKPLKLGYWKCRGLAQPIRYLLEYVDHPYEEVFYE